jgi:hypothetical protein
MPLFAVFLAAMSASQCFSVCGGSRGAARTVCPRSLSCAARALSVSPSMMTSMGGFEPDAGGGVVVECEGGGEGGCECDLLAVFDVVVGGFFTECGVAVCCAQYVVDAGAADLSGFFLGNAECRGAWWSLWVVSGVQVWHNFAPVV